MESWKLSRKSPGFFSVKEWEPSALIVHTVVVSVVRSRGRGFDSHPPRCRVSSHSPLDQSSPPLSSSVISVALATKRTQGFITACMPLSVSQPRQSGILWQIVCVIQPVHLTHLGVSWKNSCLHKRSNKCPIVCYGKMRCTAILAILWATKFQVSVREGSSLDLEIVICCRPDNCSWN